MTAGMCLATEELRRAGGRPQGTPAKPAHRTHQGNGVSMSTCSGNTTPCPVCGKTICNSCGKELDVRVPGL